jgi:prepilin-type processing-associated H-X9-DG protein
MKNVLLILGVTLVCLLGLEGLTRTVVDTGMIYELEMWKYAREVKMRDPDPAIGHRHRPNAQSHLMGAAVRTNAQGFRGPAISQQAAPGVARIAFVGDSITMGWGVREEEMFSHRVIAALQKSGRKVDGFSQGVGNLNTSQELALFKTYGAAFKPDIIVLSYFINDAEPMPKYGNPSWFDENSAAWVVLNYRLDTLSRSFGEAPDWKKYYRDLYNDNAPGWQATQRALVGFASLARELGAELVVFNIPEIRELKPYPFGDITDKVLGIVKKQGVQGIDLLPTVQALDPPSLWVTVPDPHPNGRANAAFADGMMPEIVKLLDELCRARSKGC